MALPSGGGRSKAEARLYLTDSKIPEVMDKLVAELIQERPAQSDISQFIASRAGAVCGQVFSSEPQAAPAAKPPARSPAPAPAAARAPAPAAAPAAPAARAPITRRLSQKRMSSDGAATASRVIGSTTAKPKGPSPDDDRLLESMEGQGRLHRLSGVRCAVPYSAIVVVPEGFQGDSRATAQGVIDEALDEAQRTFSHFEADSEVSAINRMTESDVHQCSPAMTEVLSAVLQLYQHSRGMFDPGVLPLLKRWQTDPHSQVPADTQAAASWLCFSFTPAGELRKTHRHSELDLTGLAKGWAIDRICTKLAKAGFDDYFVDWGGDIKVGGRHPAGRLWNVMVARPPDIGDAFDASAGDPVARIDLVPGTAVATSGDYMQNIGGRWNHIVDPKLKQLIEINADNLAQAAVVSESAMIADALATAALAYRECRPARLFLDSMRSAVLRAAHVRDYLLYARGGPRVVRMRIPGEENEAARTDRLDRHKPAHVIVVGGGLAGISATISAVQARAKVTLIEREPKLGGNSAKATSGINAVGTHTQLAQGIADDNRFFERDTFYSGRGGTTDRGLVRLLGERSAAAVNFLHEELGIPLTVLSQLGGHSKKRSHRAPPRPDGKPIPIGFTIMQHAIQYVQGALREDVTVLTKTTVQKLLTRPLEDDQLEVAGVQCLDQESGKVSDIHADAVVVTTGGFGFDHSEGSLMQEFRKDLVGVPTTCGPWTDGSGMRLGRAVGATLIDMDKVQEHPTALMDPKDPFKHTKYLGPEALRGSGGILLNQDGRRFIDELNLRSVVSQGILRNCTSTFKEGGKESRPYAWCLLNQEMQQKFGLPLLLFYRDQCGLFEDAPDTAALAKLIGCDQAVLDKTLDDYAVAFDQGACPQTGKKVFPARICSTDKGFTVARVTPCIHYCMGGLQITAAGEVQQAIAGVMGKRRPLARLFAAGEVTGGVHGSNRLGGNSLLECAVVGRVAGERAATINQEETCLKRDEWMPLVLRELRETDEQYGQSTRVYRFNLHGARQRTGLSVGQFVAVRGELDGETLQGFYSPISRPDDVGCIDILCRVDPKGGPVVELLKALHPGQECYVKAMGGLKLDPVAGGSWEYQGRRVNKINMLAGGTGIAPMLQIIRSWVRSAHDRGLDPAQNGLRLCYAAEESSDLAFAHAIQHVMERMPQHVKSYYVLNSPPLGWTQGVGIVDRDTIRDQLWFPATGDCLNVICGPPIFDKFMVGHLTALGFERNMIYAFSQDPIGA